MASKSLAYSLRSLWSSSIKYRLYGNKIDRSSPNMRFIQFQRPHDDRKRLGVVSEDGKSFAELSGGSCVSNDMMIGLITQNLSLPELEQKIQLADYQPMNDSITLLPPITNPNKIICIGLNYKDHCDEQNKPVPKEPIFFSKFSTTLVSAGGNVIAHNCTQALDWEVELAVVIGKKAKSVKRSEAMDYVFGYTIAQDITARDWQKQRNGGQFLLGKSMDTFCPLGPSIVHKNLIKDVNNLKLQTLINGVEKQCGNTSDLIFKIDDVISRLTETITLLPGDLILTGTPKGVGQHRNPPEYLKPGDKIQSFIEGLGTMENTVVASS